MAAFEGIKGSPISAFKHNLRERDKYMNEDIDQARTVDNYTISPRSHGRTTKECMDYYDRLTKNVYYRGKSTMTAGQWVVTAPEDLSPEMEEEFFRSSYDFLSEFLFQGDDTRCLLAQIHKDEAGETHMHYMFLLPEEDNKKFISLHEKLISGMKESQNLLNLKVNKEQFATVYETLQRYEKSNLSSRERYAIQDIGEALGLKRDEARKVFTRIRRLESERYEKKLMPKDSFLTRDMFNEFHPKFQEYMEEHGFDCRVYMGGRGVSLTVEQLKAITKETGLTLVDQDYLRGLEREVNREKVIERGM